MRFCVDARFTPDADPAPSMAAEIVRVAEMRASGFIELIYRRLDGTGAYLIVIEENLDAALAQLSSLPFVAESTMSVSIDPIEQL
jgi:hypothetical protein